MLKIQIIYQKIQKNKTNSIQNFIRLGRSTTATTAATMTAATQKATTTSTTAAAMKTTSMHIIRLGRSMTKSLQISCIISGISNHSKMDTKHITGNIIHMIHSTKFGTINYYTSFLPLCPCLLTIVPYPWSILII